LRFYGPECGAATPVRGAAAVVTAGFIREESLVSGRGNLRFRAVARGLVEIFSAGGLVEGTVAGETAIAAII